MQYKVFMVATVEDVLWCCVTRKKEWGLEWKLQVVLLIIVCMCILGRVLVPRVWGQCNDRLLLKSGNIVSGRYTYTRDLLRLGGFTRAKTAPLWPVSPTPLKVANGGTS